jgi:hypothetical protein
MANRTSDSRQRGVGLREGYQGKPLPPGSKPEPPKGPAAWVPAKQAPAGGGGTKQEAQKK